MTLNDYNSIDNFLKIFRDIASENPHLPIASWLVYKYLINLGVTDLDKNLDLRNRVFQDWINYYKSNSNINLDDEKNSNFCYFNSRYSIDKANDYIKIYIPLDGKHIEEGVKKIFDFIINSRIQHLSKVSNIIRFDDIVIRVIHPADAEAIINFVNNDLYLRNGLIKASPFAFKRNGIALANDGNLSYNETISTIIACYINELKEKKELDKVGVQDFYNYVYSNFYCNKDNIIEKVFKGDFEYAHNRNSVLENYLQIIKLILDVISQDFTYQSFIRHYQKCSGYGLAEFEFYLNNAIIEHYKKYGLNHCYGALVGLLKEKDYLYFTSQNNARKKLMKIPFDKIKEIIFLQTTYESMDLETICINYVDSVLKKFKNKTK